MRVLAGISTIFFIVFILIAGLGSTQRAIETPRTYRVGVLMIGDATDSNWNAAHQQGLAKAADTLDLMLQYKENVTPETCRAAADMLIADGCNIIVSTSIAFEPEMVEAAEAHHDVMFLQATGTQVRPNLVPYMGRMYQARYLAGLVAGRTTQTGAIGYVAATEIPETIRGIDAFTLGVRRAAPTATVYVRYSGTWSDDEATKAATETLLANVPAIDILAMHIDTYGPLDVARAHGIRAIGCNAASAAYSDVLLTAPIWHWDTIYEKYLNDAMKGRLTARRGLAGIETGIVGLAPLAPDVTPETTRAVRQMTQLLEDGEADVFYGPVTDAGGALRVPEGENLSDTELFDRLDWYVEGVVLR